MSGRARSRIRRCPRGARQVRRAFRRARRGTAWRRWFAPLVTVVLLLLAPALAHAQVAGPDSLVLAWSATGDDSLTGTAARYDLRMAQAPITDSTWDAATAVAGLPAPLASGSPQSVVVRGLTPGTSYWFAMRVQDDAGNWSALSNEVRWDGTVETAPPAPPTGLSALRDDAGIHLTWDASPDPNLAGYSVYRALAADGPWVKLTPVLLGTPGLLDADLPAGAAKLYYEVTASNGSGNESARSAPLVVTLAALAPLYAWNVQPGYPNPSRLDDAVRIPVTVAAASGGRLDVVDVAGHLVRRLDLRGLPPGPQEIVWDGRNDAGRPVAPGAYRAWLVAGDVHQAIRLVRVP